MIRTWIATAAALTLHATVVSAQVQHFTVSGTPASVYKAPTNVSPVVGQATAGTTLEVTRDVGSWVKVAWSQAPDGVGYLRKSAGTVSVLGPAVAPTPATTSAAGAQPSPAVPLRASVAQAQVEPAGPGARPRPQPMPGGYVTPSHRFGLGGQVGGSAMGAGFSARGWSASERFGVQADVTRYSMVNESFATRMSFTQVGPRLLYAFRDRVSNSTWVRPYTGAGVHVLRASVVDPVSGLTMSDTGMAAQIFGGTEVTLAAVPQLGVSADLGYQWYESPFSGASVGGASLTLSAHWYVK